MSTEFNIPCFFYASGKVKRVNHKLMDTPSLYQKSKSGFGKSSGRVATQVVQSSNSSSSVRQFKYFSKRVQTSQLADADVSISLQIRLR